MAPAASNGIVTIPIMGLPVGPTKVAGVVHLSYDSPAYLQARHGFPAGFMPHLAAVEAIAKAAAE